MIQDDYRAAIDLGTTKVCTILGKKRSDGSVEIAGVGVSPCNGLKRGLVTDPAATTESVRASVSAASSAAGLQIRRAYLGLSGSHIQSKNLWSKLDSDDRIAVITQSDIRKALDAARHDAAEAGRSLLHVIPRSYALDGIYGVRNPLGMHAGQMYIQSHAILGSEHPIDSLRRAAEAADVSAAGLIVQPVAAAESALTETEREEGVVLVDIGGGTTDVAVFYEGSVVHSTVIPVGGYQFTNDISVGFSSSYEEAERVKLEFGSANPDTKTFREEFTIQSDTAEEPYTVTRRELGLLLGDRATELFRMVQARLDQPHLEDLHINRMVLTGGAANLDGMSAIARYVFQGHVRVGSPRGVEGLPEEQNSPAYSASVGLLLWAMRNLPRDNHLSRSRRTEGADESRERSGKWSGALRGWLPHRRTAARSRGSR